MKSIDNQLFCFLAQGQTAQPTLPPGHQGTTLQSVFTTEVMVVLGIILVLALSLFVWAYFIRKAKPSDPHQRAIEAGPIPTGEPGSSHKHHSHRRRRHRHRRREGSRTQRNPTLQETGGLPPLRPEGEPPKF